jgi:hypothetical protein
MSYKTTTIDWSLGSTQTANIDGSPIIVGPTGIPEPTKTLLVFTNGVEETTYTLRTIQGSPVGNLQETVDTILWPNGITPNLTSIEGAIDIFTFSYQGETYANTAISRNVKAG